MKVFRLFVIACFTLFLLIHIACTLLYVLPQSMVPPSIKAIVGRYLNPLFDQGWALFAPAPDVNKKVYVSYLEDNNQWSVWQDPFQTYLTSHQSNRLTANGKIVLLVSSTLHYLHFENAELFKQKKIISGDTASGYYHVLKYEVKQELSHQDRHTEKIRLIVEYSNTECNNKQPHYIYFP